MGWNKWLAAAGLLNLAAAVLHLVIIVGGPPWYRFFGAGEGMARAAENALWMPTIITLGIASILFGWSLYAFLGGGDHPTPASPQSGPDRHHRDLPRARFGILGRDPTEQRRQARRDNEALARPRQFFADRLDGASVHRAALGQLCEVMIERGMDDRVGEAGASTQAVHIRQTAAMNLRARRCQRLCRRVQAGKADDLVARAE
jgi:hypothetical protein